MNQNSKFEANKKYFTICIYTIFVILASAIIFRLILNWEKTVGLLKEFFRIMSPFFIGFLIAYMVNPFMKFLYTTVLTKWLKVKYPKVKKAISITVSYLVVLGFIIIIIRFIVPQLISSLSELLDKLPSIYNNIYAWVDNFIDKNPGIDNQFVNDTINDSLPHLFDYTRDALTSLIPMLYTMSISIVKWFLNIIIAIIVSIYAMADKNIFLSFLKKVIYAFLPEKRARNTIETMKECNNILNSFIIGKSIDSLIIGVLCFVLMTIVQLPYAVLISVIVGITNMIPYFGPYIGAVPGIFILFITSPVKGLVFAILILALQQFDGLILGPKILGDSTGVRPIGILFAITIGGAYAGLLGMFLGVPVLGIVLHLFNKLINRKLTEKNIDL